MFWSITNFTGNNNRISRAFAVRYSSIPLDNQSSSSVHNLNNSDSVPIILPLDGEETITCFCRKTRRKETTDQTTVDTKLYLEESVLERKLPDADLKALVDIPAGLDYNEWLASHTLALFEHVNLVYGTISEFCTTFECPDMTGPGNRTYLWFDEKGKKTRVAAPQYIDYVMTFTQKTVSDETIFPTKYANEFPTSFESIARKILRLQFHVIAHLYAAHFREIALLGLHTHLNLTFAHLTALHRRFNLIDEKETDVLRDLEMALRLTDDAPSQDTTSNYESGSNNTNTAITSNNGRLYNDDSNILSRGIAGRIDGCSTTQPICTQPEAVQNFIDKSSDLTTDCIGGGGDGVSYFKSGVCNSNFYCNSNIQKNIQHNNPHQLAANDLSQRKNSSSSITKAT